MVFERTFEAEVAEAPSEEVLSIRVALCRWAFQDAFPPSQILLYIV